MSEFFLSLFLILAAVVVFAQLAYLVQDRSTAPVEAYALLPDHGYSLTKVSTDTTLQFIPGDSLRPTRT